MIKNSTAVILAAGIGSRLYPITEVMPKSLVKVCAREIIDYQIQGYIQAGVAENNIVVITGYKTSQFEQYLSKNYPKVQVVENKDYLTTNNMYSLYLALKFIKENRPNFEYLFINNADCIYEQSMVNDFVNCEYENAVACEMGKYIDESMKIKVDEFNHIKDISKTITIKDASAVSIDLYKYSKKAVSELYKIIYDYIEVKKDVKQWSEAAFPELFRKIDVYPFDIKNSSWVEVDNIDDLILADEKFSTFDYKSKKAYIIDMDGTLFVGNEPIKSSIDFIENNKNNFDFYYLTNNTSKTPETYADKLITAGVSCTMEQIITPLYSLIEYLKKYSSVYLIANKKVTDFIKNKLPNVSFDYDFDKNEALVLTYDTEIDYLKLKNACILLNKKENIKYIATHTDVFCPTENGSIPDIGSFIKLIELSTKKQPDIVLGKPCVNLIQNIIDKYGKQNIAIVGDRLYTDMVLALNSDVDFITVLSGETTRYDAAVVSDPHCCKYIYRTLGDISK